MNAVPNHVLHAHVGRQKVWYSLECLPGEGHVTVDLEEWTLANVDFYEAEGIAVDRTRCWVHDWVENHGEDCISGPDEWPGDGPWLVYCTFDNGLLIEPAEVTP